MAFYKGYGPNIVRITVWNMMTFFALEQVRRLFYTVPAFRSKEAVEREQRSASAAAAVKKHNRN